MRKVITQVCYDLSFFHGKELKEWAKAYVKVLPRNVGTLLSAGASGATIASAMLMLKPELFHKHCHPENRKSHRGTIKQFSGQTVVGEIAFVDDFIDEGKTAIAAVAQFQKWYKKGIHIKGEITCIILGYNEYATRNPCSRSQEIADCLGIPVIFANGEKTLQPQKTMTKEEKDLLIKEIMLG